MAQEAEWIGHLRGERRLMSSARHSDNRHIIDIYTRLAFIYDAWSWFTESKSLRLALDRAGIRNGESVLEVAVGTGLVFQEILRQNPSGRNVGIDLTAAMLGRARRKAEKTRLPFDLALGDARALSFADQSFDIILNNNMFGLLPEPEFAPILREMLRVLRPHGRLVLVIMTRPKNRIAEWVYRAGAGWLGGWRDVQMEPAVRAVGFEVMSRETVTQCGIPSEIISARKPGA
jgi:ubiquinone/menaquinone biosynthesis C-methylase UbiE